MAITYEWSILGMKRNSEGTVVEVNWRKTGTDENGYTAMFTQIENFSNGDPTSPDYVSFDSLTEDLVISWVQQKVVGAYKLDVDYFIARKIQEQIDSEQNLTQAMPWEETPEAF